MKGRLTREDETTGTEAEFLEKARSSRHAWERPAVTVDIVLFTVVERQLRVLLIRRGQHPFKGSWALPGGHVLAAESAEDAARRELLEETAVKGVFLEQLATFSAPGRDPRGWYISVAYYALVASEHRVLSAGTDAEAAAWFRVRDGARAVEVVPLDDDHPVALAFDHAEIITTAVKRIRGKLDYAPIAFQLLPEKFTLTELQEVHEAVLGVPLDKRNFRAGIERAGLVRSTREMKRGAHRPALLYRYAQPRP